MPFRLFDTDTIASAHAPRRLSPDTDVDVAFLRDPNDRWAPSADLLRSAAFFRLHAPSFERAWYAVVMDGASGESLAGGWFAQTAPGIAQSGIAGAFGGVHSPFAPLPSPLAARIICACEDELRARQIRHVQLTLPPAAYESETHADWMNVFLRLGYVAAPPDLSYHRCVDATPFADGLAPMQRAMLQAAERRGMRVRALTPSERADAHTIVLSDRSRGTNAVVWTLEQLLTLDGAGTDLVHWHGVFLDEQMVAASITLSLSPDCAHVHAFGQSSAASHQSPVTLLVAHLYAWCAAHDWRLLDVGLGSTNGEPNEGRVSLLRAMGLKATPQYTVEKDLVG